MVILIDPELYFISRSAFGPCHIARQIRFANWQTLCGREWRTDKINEYGMRELADDDPDTFVCRICTAHAPADGVRIDTQ